MASTWLPTLNNQKACVGTTVFQHVAAASHPSFQGCSLPTSSSGQLLPFAHLPSQQCSSWTGAHRSFSSMVDIAIISSPPLDPIPSNAFTNHVSLRLRGNRSAFGYIPSLEDGTASVVAAAVKRGTRKGGAGAHVGCLPRTSMQRCHLWSLGGGWPLQVEESVSRSSRGGGETANAVGEGVGGEIAVVDEAGTAEEMSQRRGEEEAFIQVDTRYWSWRGHKIRYQSAGKRGPAMVLIHGFGGNCDHWRKNLPELGKTHRVYAIDLLGYGYSDKPDPRAQPPNTLYAFENWGSQISDFCEAVVGGPAFLVCNSVGGIAGLQAAVDSPASVRGLVLLNISLRQLHIKRQSLFAKPFIKAFQTLLRTTSVGQFFFSQVAKPETVKKILQQAYYDDKTVTEELVEKILSPGLLPGAADVFLDFISYSGGPLPEELLRRVKCPTILVWGDKDPWEDVEVGRTSLGQIGTVEEFVVLNDVGHCPHDEAPHLVNPVVQRFVAKHAN